MASTTSPQPNNLVWLRPTFSPLLPDQQSPPLPDTFSGTADILIATTLIILIIFGILGNTSSFIYFWRLRKRAIHPKLYTMICCVDITCCLAAIPVIITLLTSRQAVLFESTVFCTVWSIMMTTLFKLAMFLVMMVSITRMIAIIFPHHIIRFGVVVKFIIGFITIVVLVDITVLVTSVGLHARYNEKEAMCEIHVSGRSSVIHYMYSIFVQAELLLSSVVIFFSFVLGTFRLMGRRREAIARRGDQGSGDEVMFLKVSITIAIFTAVFLLCNLPCFILQLAYFVAQFENKVNDVFLENRFMMWYGHLIFHFFMGLLNAAINPCLYFSRMPNYRIWTTEKTVAIPNLIKGESALSTTETTLN